jgi:hypothetical protein
MVIAWLEEEDEGALQHSGYVRNIIELLRYGYACNKSIKVEPHNVFGTAMTLGNGYNYRKIGIWIKKGVTISNLKHAYIGNVPKGPFDGEVKSRIGFKQVGDRASIEIIVFNKDIESLKEYITGDKNKQEWISTIEDQINNWQDQLININALPNGALQTLPNKDKIRLLSLIIDNNEKEYYHLATRLMGNVAKDDIKPFFKRIENEELFYRYRKSMNHDDYTAFVKAATITYYEQDGLKEKLKNLSYNKFFVHQYRNNAIGTSINNSFVTNSTSIKITGNITIVDRDPASKTPWEGMNQQPNRVTTFDAYRYEVGYCDLIGLQLYSDFGHLQVNSHDDIIPLPAFYFEWINKNLNLENNRKRIDAFITLASIVVGLYELKAAAKIGRFAFGVKMAGVVKSSVDLLLLNQKINKAIETGFSGGEEFLDYWQRFGILYDLAAFDLRNVNKKRNFFNGFTTSWSIHKDYFRNQFEPKLFYDINQVILDFKEKLNE